MPVSYTNKISSSKIENVCAESRTQTQHPMVKIVLLKYIVIIFTCMAVKCSYRCVRDNGFKCSI